jgi:DNA-binding NtrC family response regulator
MSRILVVTAEPDAAQIIQASYPDDEVCIIDSLDVYDTIGSVEPVEFAFVDVALLRPIAGGNQPAETLSSFRRVVPGARVVIMSHQKEIREAISYVRDGANEYLTYPIVREEVQLVRETIERRERISSELRYRRHQSLETETFGTITSRADSMKAVLRKIRQVAPTRSTVLLTGETGTGKSFLAKTIHQNSTRAQCQFVSIHCGAIPDTLLESELFGHERGAFTGADRRRLGKFEIATGGTLFLDEIATITRAMQVKLLNVLQERTIQRLGGEREVEVDVRILAATNVDLEGMTAGGSFRKDLFYRLNVFPIEVPPLRDRRDDIPVLVDLFVGRLRPFYHKEIDGIEPAVLDALLAYRWPGNIRELENLLERAFILETSRNLTASSFPEELFASGRPNSRIRLDTSESLAEVRTRAASAAEREYLKRQLEAHRGRISLTATAAGITPRQLNKLMTKHGLRKEDFRPGS